MISLLDTNTYIRYLNGQSPAIRERLHVTRAEAVAVCAIVKTELFYGSLRNTDPVRSRARQLAFLRAFVSFPFDDDAAETAAQIRADLARRGTPIGPHDVLIAAIALTNGLMLVTHNTGEFRRIKGLRLEDWDG